MSDQTLKLSPIDDIQLALNDLVQRTKIPGVAVAANQGRGIGLASAGVLSRVTTLPMTGQARFKISCMVKFYTAMTALKLHRAGALDLDRPIGTYLPDLQRAAGQKVRDITVRHLLSHTSGYLGFDVYAGAPRAAWAWADVVKYLAKAPQLFTPGTVFNEENIDFVIAGEILTRTSGETMTDLLRTHMFAPAGVDPVTESEPRTRVTGHRLNPELRQLAEFDPEPNLNPLWHGANSELTMSVAEMLKVVMTVLEQEDEDFKAQLFAFRAFPTMVFSHRADRWAPEAYGLGSARFGNGLYGYLASGKGQNCGVAFDDAGGGVAVGLNAAASFLRSVVLDAAFGQAVAPQIAPGALRKPEVAWSDLLGPFKPKELCGRYIGPGGEVVISGSPKHLKVSIGEHTNFVAQCGEDGQVAVQSVKPVRFGVFEDPASRRPGLMVGMHAYKKAR